MQVVLVNPQIPQNTGSIARTCAATNTALHLIEPMAFQIDEKKVRRAGLDYWPYVNLTQHKNWERFLDAVPTTSRLWYFSTHAKRPYYAAEFKPDDILVFGSETAGLGHKFLNNQDPETCLLIPMPGQGVRSLNLSNAVTAMLYHALWKSGRI